MSRFQRWVSAIQSWSPIDSTTIRLDLGSALVKYVGESSTRGVVPACVAIHPRTGEFLSFGQSALVMQGKNPAKVKIIFPFLCGRIIHEHEARLWVENFLRWQKPSGSFWHRPNVRLSLAEGISRLQLDQYRQLFSEAGVGRLQLDSQIDRVTSHMMIKGKKGCQIGLIYGVSSTQIVGLWQGEVIIRQMIEQGTHQQVEDVLTLAREKYHTSLSTKEAESVRLHTGSDSMKTLRGQDLIKRQPVSIRLTKEDLQPIWSREVAFLNRLISGLVEQMAEELLRVEDSLVDISQEYEVYLTGGGALRLGLEAELARACGQKVRKSDQPLFDTIS